MTDKYRPQTLPGPPRDFFKGVIHMTNQSFEVRSTSRSTADVQDIELLPTTPSAEPLTRRILRSLIVDNGHDPEMRVQALPVAPKRRAFYTEPRCAFDSRTPSEGEQ